MRRASQNERGAAIFLALLSLSVIGYLSLRLIHLAKSYSDLTRAYSDGINYQTATRLGITAPTTNSRSCSPQTLSGGQISGKDLGSQEWYICAAEKPAWFSSDPNVTSFKSPDFNSIFKTATPCAYARRSSSSDTFTTPKSGYTCELPSEISAGLALTDNIWALNVTVTKQAEQKSVIIASPGEIVIESLLTLSDNASIIAGGDIKIGAISYRESGAINVTVISAHGSVTISSISSGVRLLVLARQAVSAPPSPPQTSPLLPLFRAGSIAGIIPR